MTRKNLFSVIFGLTFLLTACTGVKVPVANEYQINSFNSQKLYKIPGRQSLLVTVPEAASGYQTEEMLYVNKPFKVEAFAKNAWVDAPANMLYPLIVQSLQSSGYFYAITSSAYAQGADYRLDTQLLNLEQNFLRKPSFVSLVVKVVLTRVSDNRVLASEIIRKQTTCSVDTPYGGVMAANKASVDLTAAVTHFVLSHIKHD